jgi:hypothetical protein
VLAGNLGAEVTALKRSYYRCCADLVEPLKHEKGLEFNTRVAVLSLFGMMNWIYTWYKPKVDPEADALARQVGDIFLAGIKSSVKPH